jgi:phosphodiesterase/alkaline phosphatase D-like protein
MRSNSNVGVTYQNNITTSPQPTQPTQPTNLPVIATTTAPAPVLVLKPDAPVVVTGTNPAVSSSTAIVTGQVKPNGAFTTYWFEYGETTALGSRTISQQIGSGYALLSTPAFITGLKANTLYYFRLSAKNSFATVNGSTATLQTNNTPAPTRALPTVSTGNATNITRTSADVNGKVNPNGWQTDFWFEYGKDANLGSGTATQSSGANNSVNSQTASLSNLDPLTKYFYRIDAQNQFGTVVGSILSFTTSGPAAPAAPAAPSVTTTAASNVATTAARLNGRINPNGAETAYSFEYSLDSSLTTILNVGAPTQSVPAGNSSTNVTSDVTGLVANTTYYYRLTGKNSVGTVQGAIVSFKTKKTAGN